LDDSANIGKLISDQDTNACNYIDAKYIRVSNATPKGAEQIVPMGNMLIGIWYSTPLSTTFQLFLGCRLFLVERTGVPREKKNDLWEFNKLIYLLIKQ
jgi:hypothetical protein